MRASEPEPALNIFMEEGRAFSRWLGGVLQLPAQGRWRDLGSALVAPGSLGMPITAPGQEWAVPGLTGALGGREIIQSGGLGLAVGREGE